MRVHHAHAHGECLPNRTCAQCEESFYSEEERKYCSDECREESVSFEGANNPMYQGAKETTECEICGAEFTYYPSEKPGYYCSTCVGQRNWRHRPDVRGADNPRWKSGTLELQCDICDETFERHPSNVEGEMTFCGRECQHEWLSDAFTGDGHPNWKGGGNEAYGKGWNEIRRKALERDGYECVVCGKSKTEIGRNPDVHHIIPVRAFVESDVMVKTEAHTLENVASLCVDCHRKADFGKIPKHELRSLVGADSERG